MRARLLGVLLLSVLTATAAAPAGASAKPTVVASVKPIHSLVAGVMAGVATPHLLLAGGQSPHTYTLRPSQARMLETADLIVWVGPGLEPFLARPVRNIGRESASLRLIDVKGLELLRAREGGAWTAHAHDREDAPDTRQGHESASAHVGTAGVPARELDPHIWLDPDNAVQLVDALAARLTAIDPAHGDAYAANANATRRRIRRAAARVRDILRPVAHVPYVVFHDAYHYFERRFALNAIGSIAVSPERRPGARRIIEIRRQITGPGARCVFHEPQFAPDLVETVVEGTGARVGELDPLGSDLAPGPDAYPRLLMDLARNLAGCLGREVPEPDGTEP